MPHRLTYSGRPLDRAALNRQDTAWLQAHLGAPNLRLLAVWQDQNLIASASRDSEPEPAFVTGDAARHIIADVAYCTTPMFLGLQGSIPVFALDLSPLKETDAAALVAGAGGALTWTLFLLSVPVVAFLLLIQLRLYRLAQVNLAWALLHPLSLVILFLIVAYAIWQAYVRGTVTWRGRAYAAGT